jgi:hypothetical protein
MNQEPDTAKKKKVAAPPPPDHRPPAQSQIDEERGDWEGMGQGRYQPEPEPTTVPDEKQKPGRSKT